MVNYRREISWLRYVGIVIAFVTLSLGFAPQTRAQASDPNAPYKDAYEVQTRGRLVGEWQGTISGSSISQADGQMAGQAVFVKRGFEGRNDFGIVLHDHLHRNGLEYSEISIGSIPCGPEGGAIRAINPIEMSSAPVGAYAGVNFINKLADTGRDDFSVGVGGWYGAELDNPATVVTRWSDDSFTLRLAGPFMAVVAPVRNHTFDYERQDEAYLDYIHLDVEFTLARGSIDFERTLCKEREIIDVVRTRPEEGRQNVILDGADFYIEFTDELAESSVNTGTVFMTTRDRNNGYVFVDLDLSLEDEKGAEDKAMIRIEPREPLLSGTIYEIMVAGGEDGIRGYDSEYLEEDHSFSVSTMVDPDKLRMGIYQVSRNAPLVYGKPAAARIHFEWEENEEIHSEWQVLAYELKAEVLDDRDNTIFPEIQQSIERTDQYTDEDRRLGVDTLNLFNWTPSQGHDPKDFRAEIRPDDHYPEDEEIDPAIIEESLDYANDHAERLTFDYYIAEHSEWRDGADADQVAQVVRAAQQDGAFANQIFPVASVAGHFRGSYNLQETMCGIPGAGWLLCDEDGFLLITRLGEPNPAQRATRENRWTALLNLFHEHVAAHSSADILVSYHPPSLGGGGITKGNFEQSESLRRPGDEPYWFGEPDPGLLDSLHVDRTGRNMVVMSAFVPDHTNKIPGILYGPLVAHEFGHVFGLPHTPFADSASHRSEICNSDFQTIAPGIDGMRIDLNGDTGWQKSSELGNAQTQAPLLNLMFPCSYEPHSDYWIDRNQYDWLLERMPGMLRHTRGRRAELPARGATRHAHLAEPFDGLVWRAAFQEQADEPDEQWLMISGLVDGEEAVLLPVIRVPGPRVAFSQDGSYEIQVEDASGQIIARAPVGPLTKDHDVWPFSVTVSMSGNPARIMLLQEGSVLVEKRASPVLAAPEIRSHQPGEVYRVGDILEWDDGLAEDLTYTVRFTSDGENWRALAVLLGKPSFAPDPATLFPGPASAFEIIAHDGVTERSARLPVKIEVPLSPLATWPDDGELLEVGEMAGVAFNVPLEPATLEAVTLSANGVAVPHLAKLDPSGMVLHIAPEHPDADLSYVASVDTGLRARDGRSLSEDLSIRFAVSAPVPFSQTPARSPDREVMTGERPQFPPSNEQHTLDSPDGSAKVGEGEITLELGEATTLPLRILNCETEADEIVRLEVEFETPYAQIEIDLTKENGDLFRARASHGPEGKGGISDGWYLFLENGLVSASGRLGEAGEAIGFTLTGECPAPA